MDSNFKFKNIYKVTHRRNGEVIGEYEFPNGVTDEGKNHCLDVTFRSATVQQTWYFGLIAGSGTLSDSDTMASHAGWTEFEDYTNATRWAWGPSTAASQSTTNATAVTYAITDTGTVKGVFLTSDNTKGGTTGILFSTALTTPEISVINGDTLDYTYTVSLT